MIVSDSTGNHEVRAHLLPVQRPLQKTKTRDICDAQVAIVAARIGEILYTSDPTDMRRLTAALPGKKPAIIRC